MTLCKDFEFFAVASASNSYARCVTGKWGGLRRACLRMFMGGNFRALLLIVLMVAPASRSFSSIVSLIKHNYECFFMRLVLV